MIPGINAHFCRHFIRHYWSATRIDVLHSPFVFDLYQSCIKPKQQLKAFVPLEGMRRNLQKDRSLITQLDLGSGTAVSKQKTVGELARLHAKPRRIVQILYRMLARYEYRNVIELGTSLGLSSAYLATALREFATAEETSFTTIEGAPGLAAVAQDNFRQLGVSEYIHSETGNFDDVLPKVLRSYNNVDLAFVDGNHRYEPTMDYFKQLLQKTHNNSVLVFDDIYWSPGMTQAWEEIKQHPQVRQTVDLFFIGLVFFRSEQVPEHFRLRIL